MPLTSTEKAVVVVIVLAVVAAICVALYFALKPSKTTASTSTTPSTNKQASTSTTIRPNPDPNLTTSTSSTPPSSTSPNPLPSTTQAPTPLVTTPPSTSTTPPGNLSFWHCLKDKNYVGSLQLNFGHTNGDALWACQNWVSAGVNEVIPDMSRTYTDRSGLPFVNRYKPGALQLSGSNLRWGTYDTAAPAPDKLWSYDSTERTLCNPSTSRCLQAFADNINVQGVADDGKGDKKWEFVRKRNLPEKPYTAICNPASKRCLHARDDGTVSAEPDDDTYAKYWN